MALIVGHLASDTHVVISELDDDGTTLKDTLERVGVLPPPHVLKSQVYIYRPADTNLRHSDAIVV